MPTYQIKAPDGNTYRVDGPDGATEEDIRSHVLSDHPEAGNAAPSPVAQPAAPSAPPVPAQPPEAEPGDEFNAMRTAAMAAPKTISAPGSVFDGQPDTSSSPSIAQRGGPLTTAAYEQARLALANASPEQRSQMALQPGYRGAVARAVESEWSGTDQAAQGLPALSGATDRREDRVARQIRAGASPQTAENIVSGQQGTGEMPADSVSAIPDGTVKFASEKPGLAGQAVDAVMRGANQLAATSNAAVGSVLKLYGLDSAADAAMRTMDADQQAALHYPSAPPDAVRSPKSAAEWVINASGENAPMLLAMMLPGAAEAKLAQLSMGGPAGIEALISRFVTKKVAEGVSQDAATEMAVKIIQKRIADASHIGNFAGNAALNIGQINEDVYRQTGQIGELPAVAGGVVSGLLGSIPTARVMVKALGPQVTTEMADSLVQKIGLPAAEEVMKQGGLMALMNAGMAGVNTLAASVATGNPVATKETLDKLVDAGLSGFLLGGTIGGLSGATRASLQAWHESYAGRMSYLAREMRRGVDLTKTNGSAEDIARQQFENESKSISGEGTVGSQVKLKPVVVGEGNIKPDTNDPHPGNYETLDEPTTEPRDQIAEPTSGAAGFAAGRDTGTGRSGEDRVREEARIVESINRRFSRLGQPTRFSLGELRLPDPDAGQQAVDDATFDTFGDHVAFVDSGGKQTGVNGFVLPDEPNKVYLMMGAGDNPAYTLPHEIGHGIINKNPDLFAWWLARSRSRGDMYKEMATAYHSGAQDAHDAGNSELANTLYDSFDNVKVVGGHDVGTQGEREAFCDWVAHLHNDPEFAERLAEHSPNFFGKLVDAIKGLYDQFLGKLQGHLPETLNWFKDSKALRDDTFKVLTQAADRAQKKREQATGGESELAASRSKNEQGLGDRETRESRTIDFARNGKRKEGEKVQDSGGAREAEPIGGNREPVGVRSGQPPEADKQQAGKGRLPERGGVRGGVQRLDEQRGENLGHDQPLEGLPTKVEVDGHTVDFGPFAPARDAAEAYVKSTGREYAPPTKFIKVNPERSTRIAQAFEEMEHSPDDPEVKAAYRAMIDETLAQWQEIKKTGLQVEFNDGRDPYGNPRNAILDVTDNNHLYVFSTADGFGSDEHIDVSGNPLLEATGETIGGKPALANDIFRIVHDYFGHVKEGVGFRADGEDNAWRSHAAMYSDLARKAMTTETRGQNSWVNFGPYAEHNRTASGENTHYAPQKIGLLPDWAMEASRSSAVDIREGENPKEKLDLNEIGSHFDAAIKKKYGGHLDFNNPKDFKVAVKQATDEFKYQLGQEKSGLDWYDHDIKNAFDITSKVIPELKDPDQQQLFTVVAAILSPDVKARENWGMAATAYQHYKSTGQFPETNPESNQLWAGYGLTKAKAIAHLNSMIKDMGERDTVEWLLTDHPISQLRAVKMESGVYKGHWISGKNNDSRLGVEIFGDKVGPFALNLNGLSTHVTVDKWMTRTFNRYFGTVLDRKGVSIEAPSDPQKPAIAKLVTDVAKATGYEPSQVQSVLWFFEQQLYNKLGAGSKSYAFSDGAKSFFDANGGERGRTGRQDEEVSGVHPQDETGQQADFSRTQTPAFKQWFGDSKQVDEDGKPKVWYHGTAQDVKTFKPKQAGSIFLTEHPGFAEAFSGSSKDWMIDNADQVFTHEQLEQARQETFARIDKLNETKGEKELLKNDYKAQPIYRNVIGDLMPSGENTVPLFVRAEKTFDYEDPAQRRAVAAQVYADDDLNHEPGWRKKYPNNVDENGNSNFSHARVQYTQPEWDEQMINAKADALQALGRRGNWGNIESSDTQQAIKKLGYDSYYVSEGGIKNLAVYDPNQVKAAYGNSGDFSTTNNDIDASRTSTPQFKKWFGDSKVVDDNGKPLVVYHSNTYGGGFGAFDKSEQRKGMAGFGFYFSDDDGANIYAEHAASFKSHQSWDGKEKAVNTIPVYLKMDNPLRIDDIADVAARFKDPGAFGVSRSVAGLSADAKSAVQRAGYDGVIANEYVKRARDGSLSVVKPDTNGAIAHPVYVVFESTQIKSSIGNNGDFNPNDSDINASRSSYNLYQDMTKEERKSSGAWAGLVKLFAPSARGDMATLQAGIMRSQLAEQAHQSELAAQAMLGHAKVFHKMDQADQYAFIDRYERGAAQPTPELRAAAADIKAYNDKLRTEVQNLGTGKLQTFNDNYLGRIWTDPAKAQSVFGKRPLEGSKGFLKQRTFEYFMDGINAGLTPITSNPVEMVLLKGAEMNRYIYGQKIIQEMHNAGLTMVVPFDGRGPDGWTKINDKIAQVGSKGSYWAPDEAATLINNHLSPGFQGNGIYDFIRHSGIILNSAQLGLSAFHLGFTTLDSMVSKAALGAQQLSRGQIIKGVANVAQSMNPLQPFMNLYKGDKLFRAYMGDLSNPAMRPIVEALIQGGGRVKLDDFYKNDTVNAFRQAVRRRDIWGATKKLLPTLMDKINAPIFEYLVPRQKLGIFFDLAKDWIERNPNAGIDETREAMGKFWDSVDNRMGQLVYDNVFWNRALKDSLMISVRSVGWNLGTFRELGGGVKDMKDIWKNKEISSRTGYLIALPFVTAMMGALTQYLYTGSGPQELKDYFFPKTGRKRPDGTDDRVSLPSYMKDIYAYAHDLYGFGKYGSNPFNTLQNKLHPLLSMVAQMISNKDFFGGAIRSPGDPMVQQLKDEADFIVKQISPFGIRNFQQQQKTKGQQPTVAGYLTSPSMIGITPAPAHIVKNDAQNESSALSGMKDSLVAKFRQELKDGANPVAIRRRMESAGMLPAEITTVIKQGTQPPKPASTLRHLGNR
jgi:ADP-Ribosyltransferase in polyvalent proteins